MKKSLASSLAALFIVFMLQGTANASEQIITPKTDYVPIYDNRSDTLKEIGKMRLGEPLIALKSHGDNWWQVKFANAYGYINKNDVQLQKSMKVPARNYQANSNTAININKDTDIYDNSSGKLKSFAVAKKGYKYPILSDFGSWWKVDAGGRIGFIAKSTATVDKGTRVLMYHHILTAKEKADSPFANLSTTITDTEFNEQMNYLKSQGFTTISTKDLEGYLNRQVNLPARSILLTIDDGNISSRIYAYPKLKELGFTADQFIITSRTPATPSVFNHKQLNFLSKQEMNEMTDVFNYHAHTHGLHSLTAKNESFLTAKSRDVVKQDLLLNRKLLNQTRYLAYPFGQYNSDTLKVLNETGFTMAFTTKTGFAKLGVNKLLIPRQGIEPNYSLKKFAEIVDTGTLFKKPDIPKPVPKPDPKPDSLFTDINKSDDYYEPILSLTNRGIIQGFPDGTFRPHNEVTRGQAAKILANVLNLDMKNVENPGFTDIPETHQYYKPVAALVKAGIVGGYDNKTFRPGNNLTRAQMAKILTLGFKLKDEELTDTRFTDIKKSDAFSGYVQSLLTHNITIGTTPTTFSPNTFVKRRQLALFVTRSETAIANKPEVPVEVVPEEVVLKGNLLVDDIGLIDGLKYVTATLTEDQTIKDIETLTVQWFNTANELVGSGTLTDKFRAEHQDTTQISMPYDASFDYETVGAWIVEGAFTEEPIKAVVTVTFTNGKVVTVEK